MSIKLCTVKENALACTLHMFRRLLIAFIPDNLSYLWVNLILDPDKSQQINEWLNIILSAQHSNGWGNGNCMLQMPHNKISCSWWTILLRPAKLLTNSILQGIKPPYNKLTNSCPNQHISPDLDCNINTIMSWNFLAWIWDAARVCSQMKLSIWLHFLFSSCKF